MIVGLLDSKVYSYTRQMYNATTTYYTFLNDPATDT